MDTTMVLLLSSLCKRKNPAGLHSAQSFEQKKPVIFSLRKATGYAQGSRFPGLKRAAVPVSGELLYIREIH